MTLGDEGSWVPLKRKPTCELTETSRWSVDGGDEMINYCESDGSEYLCNKHGGTEAWQVFCPARED